MADQTPRLSTYWGLPLGPLERQIMAVLWAQSPATVRDLHRSFRTRAYRTLVVTLDRLYKKGLVRRERANRFNAYAPTMSREELATAIADSIIGPRA